MGMAHQKVCKQGSDDIKVKVKYIRPCPYIFCNSTCMCVSTWAQDM